VSGITVEVSTLVLRTVTPVPDLVERLACPSSAQCRPRRRSPTSIRRSIRSRAQVPYYISTRTSAGRRSCAATRTTAGRGPHNLDAVVYVAGIDTGPAAAQIVEGKLDYLAEQYPDYGALQPGGDIARRYASEDANASGRRDT
jgi:hypothetical protein